MAVPKKRTSKSRKRMRRSHHALRAPGLSVCPVCGASKLPHRVCAECGTYRGRQVVEVQKEDEL
ncbi:MAG: 50S ribosomal protein L32 [Proteobacteria bacterium]|nr:50S ribosomal protein L32 [Pseudomonadota bacterium]